MKTGKTDVTSHSLPLSLSRPTVLTRFERDVSLCLMVIRSITAICLRDAVKVCFVSLVLVQVCN